MIRAFINKEALFCLFCCVFLCTFWMCLTTNGSGGIHFRRSFQIVSVLLFSLCITVCVSLGKAELLSSRLQLFSELSIYKKRKDVRNRFQMPSHWCATSPTPLQALSFLIMKMTSGGKNWPMPIQMSILHLQLHDNTARAQDSQILPSDWSKGFD